MDTSQSEYNDLAETSPFTKEENVNHDVYGGYDGGYDGGYEGGAFANLYGNSAATNWYENGNVWLSVGVLVAIVFLLIGLAYGTSSTGIFVGMVATAVAVLFLSEIAADVGVGLKHTTYSSPPA
jgi:hypothetical protein